MARMAGLPDLGYGTPVVQPTPVGNVPSAGGVFRQLADTAKQVGDAISEQKNKEGEQEGAKAVTRDSEGNIQVADRKSKWWEPLFAPEMDAAYEHAAKLAYISETALDVRQKIGDIQAKHIADPDGFRAALDGLRESFAEKTPMPEWAQDIDLLLREEGHRALLNITNTKIARDMDRARGSVDALIKSYTSDAYALARQGAVGTPDYQRIEDRIRSLVESKRDNTAFNVSPEEIDLEINTIVAGLEGAASLHIVDLVLKSEGADAATEIAIKIFNDPDLKLSPEAREAFVADARQLVSQHEAERRQAMAEAQLRLGTAVEDARAAAEAGENPWALVSQRELADAYGPERAARLVTELNFQRGTANAAKEIALATPAEEAALLERARPSGEGFAMEQERFNTLATAIERKRTAIAQDAVGYLLGNSAHLQTLARAADEGDAAAKAEYAAAVLAQQAAQGVPVHQRGVVTKGQAEILANQLQSGSPDEAVGMLQSVTAGLNAEQLTILSRQVAKQNRAAAVAVAAARDDPRLASDIIIGDRFLAENGDAKPEQNELSREMDALAGDLFQFAPDARANAAAAALGLYGSRIIGSKPGQTDRGKLRDAIKDVLGNPVRVRGRTIVPPRPDMRAGDVEKLLRGVNDAAVANFGNGQPVDASGRVIPAAVIAQHGVLTYTGAPGLYAVSFRGQGHLGVQGGDGSSRTFLIDLGRMEREGIPRPLASALTKGMIEPGTKNPLSALDYPPVRNADGSVSNVITKSFGIDGQEVLLPTMIGGQRLTDAQAIEHYRATGEHFGKFESVAAAKAYAEEVERGMNASRPR